MQFALALYHNEVDDEDELEFRKGDVLTVLIENPNGLDGWWLCEHKGKCGLCPANRLKLLPNKTKFNDPTRSSSCLSTTSIYDDLSNDYDIPISAKRSSCSSNHDYDIPHRSDFLSATQLNKPIDSSPESSSRSSGIYSSIDLSSSSLSSEFHTSTPNNHHLPSLSSMELDQLQDSFRKLSIRSLLVDKYRQILSNSHLDSHQRGFISECRLFLHEYGCLFDRQTYRLFKQNLLYEFEHLKNPSRLISLATQILRLIKPIIDLRLKEKQENLASIPIDVLKKLNLEPIEEISNENETKKLPTSISTTEIYAQLQTHSLKSQSRPSHMTSSKTCHSNFLFDLSKKSDDYDYIEDDYSHRPISDPLIRCYHRHIREHIHSMLTRYSHLYQWNSTETKSNAISSLITEGKTLVVAGHKLLFILETLQEHLRQSTKHEQIPMALVHLSKQLTEALTSFVRLLKQLSQNPPTKNNNLLLNFQHDTRSIINITKRIKRQCTAI